jgi:hypothetical protein
VCVDSGGTLCVFRINLHPHHHFVLWFVTERVGSIRANSTNRWRDETSDFIQICTVDQELLCNYNPQRIFKNSYP